jgi:monoamine oxidase
LSHFNRACLELIEAFGAIVNCGIPLFCKQKRAIFEQLHKGFSMNRADVIIIGAGAAGLAASRELVVGGKKVFILEARNRIGGRIYALTVPTFSIPLEAGVEFIHGEMPVTQSLLKEAGIPYYASEGNYYSIRNGKFQQSDSLGKTFSVIFEKAGSLKQDLPFAKFLEQYLNEDKYKTIRETAKGLAEGYDVADVQRVSTYALIEEWKDFGQSESYRINGGHIKLAEFLSEEIKKQNGKIFLSTVVKEIRWSKDKVEVIDRTGKSFLAQKVLISVPLGVLQSQPNKEAYINFSPPLSEKLKAAKSIGYGTVIKVFLEFNNAFWESSDNQIRTTPELGMLISDTPFTAWWTQLPDKTPFLTGWLAGPNAEKNKNNSEDEIIEMALGALCYIFNTNKSFLSKNLLAGKVINWQTDPFSLGAYSFATVESTKARKLLAEPIEETIFFAGEALSEGAAMGTLEVALENGIQTAKKLLSCFKS